jgi:two-component system OmpR family sensor kinase
MSLRLRLVAALGGLLVLGLVAFGVGTYARYSAVEYDRLDERLRSVQPIVSRQLGVDVDGDGNDGGPGPGGRGRDGRGGAPAVALTGTYAELRAADGSVVNSVPTFEGLSPDLPADLTLGRTVTVGSTDGSGDWRVYATAAGDRVVVVAVPTAEVERSLRGLVLIETFAGLVLLAVVTGGAWLILRRGLRPLEDMAVTARSITAGDLSQRVPEDERSEVGQLGHALNSMLGDLEGALAERDATEEKLRRFLADAAHELRTPLTSIRGFAELFRLDTDTDHVDRGVIVRRIEEESTRMKTLVDDLLLLARLDQTQPVATAPVDLAVLAADACSDAVAADRTRPVTLDAPEPVVMNGVGDHLRQAMANLVTNAVRHTPAGTALEVTARREGGYAVVRVRDHGPGLDAEALVHVFDRFWQADKARVGTGAGLGLSIVASIARRHGGTVEAANAADGGAVFTLRLPATIDR